MPVERPLDGESEGEAVKDSLEAKGHPLATMVIPRAGGTEEALGTYEPGSIARDSIPSQKNLALSAFSGVLW